MNRCTMDGESAEAVRASLRGKTGRRLWRSLDELARTPAFLAFLDAEFPALAAISQGVDRRTMLKTLAASLALAGVAGCDGEPDERSLPYVDAPAFAGPANARWYATAVAPFGYAQPVLGKTYAGRPVKLEGNPDHPASRGATDAFTQAALFGLYDPTRSQSPRRSGQPATWDAFDAAVQSLRTEADARHGRGFRLLTGAVASPTLRRQVSALLARWPEARWHVLEPLGDGTRASRRAFGRPLERHLQLDQCEVLVSLDDDILGPGPSQLVHGLGWARRRRERQGGDGACRLLVAEPTPSATGAMAAERLPASPERISALLTAIGGALGIDRDAAPALSEPEQTWMSRCADELRRHRGRSLLTIGSFYPASLQVRALEINERLGNLGATLRFTEPIFSGVGAHAFEDLVEDMSRGQVSSVLVLDANPAYLAAPDLEFAQAMGRVALRMHAGLYYDETASLCHWHLPLHHELERWSDGRSVDGTAGIIQPLIRPLYATRSPHELLGGLPGGRVDDRQDVQDTWRRVWDADFDARWNESLLRGFIADSAPPFVTVSVRGNGTAIDAEPAARGLTALLRPDPTIWDGRFGNNAWLQELPKPLSKLTWGNAILLSPRLAAEHGLQNGDELLIEQGGRAVTGPAWIAPGQVDRCVTLSLGYGQSLREWLADDPGYNAFALRGSQQAWHLADVRLAPTGRTRAIASTQLHQALDGFDFVRTVSAVDADALAESRPQQASFYPTKSMNDPSWGMSIDLDLCIGCNACVVACVAENNIPVVGKELVAQGREMHWLRVDHYHEGDPDNPRSHFQPVPCMHCELAPCEMGCPVNATVHSYDGLNLQVYNRCIGTRTCSSFCPYKVRRFNWFDFTGEDPESIRAMRNPEVTVRARGVMEKCTYCVQRISAARIAAQIAGHEIREGAVATACQQACPTTAIVFGNVADPASAVSRRKASPRNYSLLEEVNTRPRTTYLARIEDGGPPAPTKS